ncbi:MAG TPA: heavy metal-associated domain-containing protein [Roseiflexaceae bacterium]|nr:heavy metal-associated domain-containing protein [Roseiflexaceae bacterium]
MQTFKVEDMTCGGCAASIRSAVSRVEGVRSVTADPQSKDVVVDAAAGVSREQIVATLTAAGYTQIRVVEVPAQAAS